MSIILSHSTARAVWRTFRTPPQPEEPPLAVHDITRCKPLSADATLAQAYLERIGIEPRPLHCLTQIKHAKPPMDARYVQMHIDSSPLEPNELYELTTGVYIPCVEACALQAAREMDLPELAEYYYELTGSYGLEHDNQAGYIERLPLTTKARLKAYFDRAKGIRGNTLAKQALKYVREGCRSPLETAMSLMIVLPKKMGGLGIRGYHTNYAIKIPGFARRFTRRTCFYFDGYLESSKTDLEYDGFYHDELEIRAIDEERRLALKAMGYSVITISKHSFFDRATFQRIMAAIRRQEKLIPSRFPDGFQLLQENLRRFVLRRYIEAEETQKERALQEMLVATPCQPLDALEALEINAVHEPDDGQHVEYSEPEGKIFGSKPK